MKFASETKKDNKPNLLYNPTKRLSAILLLMVFLFCAVFCKMFAVIILDGGNLQVKATSQWLRDVPTDAPRGRILDRNGKVLASTATRYNLYVRPGTRKTKKRLRNFFATRSDTSMRKLLKKSRNE